MASTSTQKGKQAAGPRTPQEIPPGGDWRSRGLLEVPTEAAVAAVKLPFEIYPETADCYPSKYTVNLRHLQAGQEQAPWTGYYATYKGAKLAVSSMFGAWFEIRKREDGWEAIRLARVALELQGQALPGIQ
jgi:hypothetical protein